jgi:AbrB family looped-hinge helix DNA binding protein
VANATYLTLDKKGRATLPEEVREALGVGPGDFVLLERTAAGGYELIAAELLPRDQRWFYHPEMQERVRVAEEEIASGLARRESAADLTRRLGEPARKRTKSFAKPSKKSR